ncbi:MAG: hypothetical protein RL109_1392, partial [Pseudomonadota bacterium]
VTEKIPLKARVPVKAMVMRGLITTGPRYVAQAAQIFDLRVRRNSQKAE